MRKKKKWAIAGAILLGAGIVICALSLGMTGFDMTKLSTVKFEENTYEISEDFDSISIDADTENITFALSDDENCKVVCYEETDAPHHVRVEDHTLVIDKAQSEHMFYFAVEVPGITVYLPKTQYQAITVDSDTSDVVIPEDFSFDSINVTLSAGDVTCLASAEGAVAIKTDTGEVTISDIFCGTLTWTGDTGDLIMTNVVASDAFHLESGTGDIKLDGCDAGEIYALTDTGDITGTLLSDKIFTTATDTGDVDVPKTTTGGRCELSTDTGDIRIGIR